MRINKDGNVGIGTASPGNPLQVDGTFPQNEAGTRRSRKYLRTYWNWKRGYGF